MHAPLASTQEEEEERGWVERGGGGVGGVIACAIYRQRRIKNKLLSTLMQMHVLVYIDGLPNETPLPSCLIFRFDETMISPLSPLLTPPPPPPPLTPNSSRQCP